MSQQDLSADSARPPGSSGSGAVPGAPALPSTPGAPTPPGRRPGDWPRPGSRDRALRADRTRRRATADRLVGLDIARFLALVGMMGTHVWSTDLDTGEDTIVTALLSGKAAALFAVLAGVGIVLTTRRALADGNAAAARLAVFGRGLALILLGLCLGLIPGGVYVIIVYYGVTFWFAIPMLRWRIRPLLITAAVWAVVWPFVSHLWRSGIGNDVPSPEIGSASWFDLADPAAFGRGILLTGVYPALTWIVYVLVGMAIGRGMLAARAAGTLRRFSLVLAGIGAVTAILADRLSALLLGPLGGVQAIADGLGLGTTRAIEAQLADGMYGTSPTDSVWWLAGRSPHSGTTLDLAFTAGIAAAVIGLCLALGLVLSARWRTALMPLTGAGAAPLTVYASHVLLVAIGDGIAWFVRDDAGWLISSPQLWAAHVVVALLIGWLIAATHRRGPLETFVHAAGLALASAAPPAPPAPPSAEGSQSAGPARSHPQLGTPRQK
ncbi:heparan-alpha-glucosaminide N-acetyltransferase domain-containing protein [Plantibacter sp. YIM 135249]|uniref:heparan-alpha-glucosaminide N-acetyltransferase domain-containing protein n=1 Tax=Plantibacter sp. YIM 135249 TaxID=3423918 RepID=UPI003D356655